MKWDPKKQAWVDAYDQVVVPPSRWRHYQRGRAKGLIIILAIGLVVAGYFAVSSVRGGERQGVVTPVETPSASPSLAPTYALPPAEQTKARVAFAQMHPAEQANLCGFFAAVPRDAVKQAVRAGVDREYARQVVQFVAGELC